MQIQILVVASGVRDVAQVECLGIMVVSHQTCTLQKVMQILLQDGSASVTETTVNDHVNDHDRPLHRSAYGEAAVSLVENDGLTEAEVVNGAKHVYVGVTMREWTVLSTRQGQVEDMLELEWVLTTTKAESAGGD